MSRSRTQSENSVPSTFHFHPGLQGTTQLMSQMSCIFCNVSRENGFRIVYENDQFIAFEDHAPAARFHFLVIPKEHITSVHSLNKKDVDLVQSMQDIGDIILTERSVEKHTRRMGFNIPPLTTINHLHLHVQALPYIPRFRAIAYPVSRGYGSNYKGFSWFVEAGQAIQILKSSRQIGILPC